MNPEAQPAGPGDQGPSAAPARAPRPRRSSEAFDAFEDAVEAQGAVSPGKPAARLGHETPPPGSCAGPGPRVDSVATSVTEPGPGESGSFGPAILISEGGGSAGPSESESADPSPKPRDPKLQPPAPKSAKARPPGSQGPKLNAYAAPPKPGAARAAPLRARARSTVGAPGDPAAKRKLPKKRAPEAVPVGAAGAQAGPGSRPSAAALKRMASSTPTETAGAVRAPDESPRDAHKAPPQPVGGQLIQSARGPPPPRPAPADLNGSVRGPPPRPAPADLNDSVRGPVQGSAAPPGAEGPEADAAQDAEVQALRATLERQQTETLVLQEEAASTKQSLALMTVALQEAEHKLQEAHEQHRHSETSAVEAARREVEQSVAQREAQCVALEEELRARLQRVEEAEQALRARTEEVWEQEQALEERRRSTDAEAGAREQRLQEQEAGLRLEREKFDARSQALKEREGKEGKLVDREFRVKQRESAVGTRDEQLNRKEKAQKKQLAELSKLEAKVQRQADEVDKRAKRVDALTVKYEKDLEVLTGRQAALAEKEAELKAAAKDLQERTADVGHREKSLAAAEDDFGVRDEGLRASEADVAQRLEACREREEALDRREADIADRTETLRRDEAQAVAAQAEVARAREALAAAEADLVRREAQVREDGEASAAARAEAQRVVDSIAQREQAAAKAEKAAKGAGAESDRKLAELTRYDRKLQQQQKALQEGEAAHERREAAIHEQEADLAARRHLMEGRWDEFVTRQADVERREEAVRRDGDDVERRTGAVAAKERDVAAREAAAAGKEEALVLLDERTQKAEASLASKQSKFTMLEQARQQWENSLLQKEKQHSKKVQDLEARQAKVREAEEASRAQMLRVKAADEQMKWAQERIRHREAEVEAAKTQMAKKEMEVEERGRVAQATSQRANALLLETQQEQQRLRQAEESLAGRAEAVDKGETELGRDRAKFDEEYAELMQKKKETVAKQIELVQWMKEMEWRERLVEEMEDESHRAFAGVPARAGPPRRVAEPNLNFGQALISVQLNRLQQSYIAKQQLPRRRRDPFEPGGGSAKKGGDALLQEVEGLSAIGELDKAVKAKVRFVRVVLARAKVWEAGRAADAAADGAEEDRRVFTAKQRRDITAALEREGALHAEDDFLRRLVASPLERRTQFGGAGDLLAAVEEWWLEAKGRVIDRITGLMEARLALVGEALDAMEAQRLLHPDVFQVRPANADPGPAPGPAVSQATAMQYVTAAKVKPESLFKVHTQRAEPALSQTAKARATRSLGPDLSELRDRYQMYGAPKQRSPLRRAGAEDGALPGLRHSGALIGAPPPPASPLVRRDDAGATDVPAKRAPGADRAATGPRRAAALSRARGPLPALRSSKTGQPGALLHTAAGAPAGDVPPQPMAEGDSRGPDSPRVARAASPEADDDGAGPPHGGVDAGGAAGAGAEEGAGSPRDDPEESASDTSSASDGSDAASQADSDAEYSSDSCSEASALPSGRHELLVS